MPVFVIFVPLGSGNFRINYKNNGNKSLFQLIKVQNQKISFKISLNSPIHEYS